LNPGRHLDGDACRLAIRTGTVEGDELKKLLTGSASDRDGSLVRMKC
jgi:hypothetical protein